MTEAAATSPHASCPGKSAKRVFAHKSRAFTSLQKCRKEDVDGRDKPGHDEHINSGRGKY
jgi:penicillin-binding protein 1C